MRNPFKRSASHKNYVSPFSVNESKPVNDNLYLAAASQAAVADVASGAYDEFLFNDDGIQNMPFEEAVDKHSVLLASRMNDASLKELVRKSGRLTRTKSSVQIENAHVDEINDALSRVASELEQQELILVGDKTGKHDISWVGSPVSFTGIGQARFKLMVPYMLFLLVGGADLYIFVKSLGSVMPNSGRDIYFFAAPAVGIQVGFPHLIGERLAWTMRSQSRRKMNIFEILILGLAWSTFCLALTYLRFDFLKQDGGEDFAPLLALFTLIMTFLMILGLGALLIFSASRSNPHEMIHLRLQLRRAKLLKKLAQADSKLKALEADLQVAKDEYQSYLEFVERQKNSDFDSLRDAAKSVYRRALINTMGQKDFTSSYLASKQQRQSTWNSTVANQFEE